MQLTEVKFMAWHPMDADPNDKLTFAVGFGTYHSEKSLALGAFYRANENTMLSVGGTMDSGDAMFNMGRLLNSEVVRLIVLKKNSTRRCQLVS